MELLRAEYPRPNFVRQDWLTLNGEWDFAFDDDNCGLREEWFKREALDQKIIVPFCYQSELSSIGTPEYHPIVWYQRSFVIPQDWTDRRILINFNAVDYQMTLWVNGHLVGSHKGGYSRAVFDITHYLTTDPNSVTIRVEDFMVTTQPRGKQTARSESWACWYTPVTGIWQSVWLEAVGETYLDHIKVEPDIDNGAVTIKYWLDGLGVPVSLDCYVKKDGKDVVRLTKTIEVEYGRFSNITPYSQGEIKLEIPEVELWSPEDPQLYDLELSIHHGDYLLDHVSTYFGMRKISVENGKVCLNNEPYYLRMVLDQGYWPTGIYTAPSIADIKYDIEMTKAFGFNGARKHQKFEDPYYYYYCDQLGLLTWCEMPSCYVYDEEVALNLTNEWQRLVVQHYNYPSVMAWVPLNESWGVDQLTEDESDGRLVHFIITLYHLTKSLDSQRLVVGNDGWQHAETDLISIHEYTQDAEDLRRRYAQFKKDRYGKAFSHGHPIMLPGFMSSDKPIMITEFGGVKAAEQEIEGWGYGDAAESYEAMLDRIANLVQVITSEGELSGYCYTQLTDVEQEVNGLLTYDRRLKVDSEKLQRIFSSQPE